MTYSKLLYLSAVAVLSSFAAGQACTFTVSSSGGISCPAGQLDDGQIRLNGTEAAAQFTISDGKITDSAGRGCIITDPPTTQVQCDLNKLPMSGFSIGADGIISYQGSSQFYACPATDTEYNIYVHPDFGQTKCFGVTLTASACGQVGGGGGGTASSCAPPVTKTVYQMNFTTVTVTQMVSRTCYNTTTSGVLSSGRCQKCQKTTTTTSASKKTTGIMQR